MRDVQDAVRSLTKSLVEAATNDETDTGGLPVLWHRLQAAGLTTLASGQDEDGGDLDDLSACVEVLCSAGRSVPLIEHATASIAHAAADGHLLTVAPLTDGPRVEAGRVGGRLVAVPWGDRATHVVLLRDSGPALLAALTQDGVTVTGHTNVAGEPVATVDFDGAAIEELVGAPPSEYLADRLALLRAVALVAASDAAYLLTDTYVRTREQFGAPLVRVPAVAHNLATMKVHLVQASAALRRAQDLVRTGVGPRQVRSAVVVARIVAGGCATEVARIAHQLHGAMGVTAEYPLHRLTRRLWAWRELDGTQREYELMLGRLATSVREADYWEWMTA